MLCGDRKGLRRPFGHSQQDGNEECDRAADEDDALHDIGPDDSANAAEQGVKCDDYAIDDDQRLQRPAGEGLHAEGRSEENCPHTRDLGDQIAHDRISPRPRAKSFLQMGKRRKFARAAIERDEVAHGDVCRRRDGEAENERVPVSAEGLARHAEKSVARQIGAEDRQADRPTRQITAGGHVLPRCSRGTKKPAPKDCNADKIGAEYDQVGGWER